MAENVFCVKNLKVYFELSRGFGKDFLEKTGKKKIKAVDGIDLEIRKGEILSLVGESGSGKTTTGKAILELVKSSSDSSFFNDKKIDRANKAFMKDFRQKAQMIYQDPYQSLNPREQILDIVAEALDVNKLVKTDEERITRVKEALENAGLTPAESYFYRYPYELSGGQRQRVVIASAMIMNPELVIADEPVSMLDASIRTGILKLMLDLRKTHHLSYLFITHDLSLAWLISDRIAIMYLGKIMEIGNADTLIKDGRHPYSKALTAIMPRMGIKASGERPTLQGETPNPSEVNAGCKFKSRCPIAAALCDTVEPELKKIGEDHFAACHFVNQGTGRTKP
jgi:peptide/nickel transport system ATP-binding protein